MKQIRAARDVSVNDVVLAVVAGCLKRWLEAHGRDTRALELSADADLVPDLENLERGLEEAFAALLGSAG